MIELNIPGRGLLRLEHLVCDLNGTLAVDGNLLEGIPRILKKLSDRLAVHVLTANTRKNLDTIELQLGLSVHTILRGEESQQKAAYVRALGAETVIAIGQGANDAAMLREAAIGICVISQEGTSISALQSADLLVPNIYAAFELIEKPLRLVASLRQ
ncbi:MAG: HAD family hydrolase [Anaerolineales bacterium]|nr:HAD family hydrolase [Anaerolineales bacterium]MDW8162067.1 HAD family hydrolase [Anaerolineales bacterium]